MAKGKFSVLHDLVGDRFGRLMVVSRADNKGRATMWLCRCDCGVDAVVSASHLRSGHSQSCGCLVREKIGAVRRTHGESKSLEFSSWMNMRRRCLNETDPAYVWYGARGIGICTAWDNFSEFLKDMGPKPSPRHSIERLDVNGHYAPGNCVWATAVQQGRNQRRTKLTLEKAEEIRRLAESGVSRRALRERFGVCKATVSHIINGHLWVPET